MYLPALAPEHNEQGYVRVRPHARRGTRGVRAHYSRKLRLIRNLEDPKYALISLDSEAVKDIGDSIGKDLSEYDGALVETGDGDYKEVWVFNGVPVLDKVAVRVV